MVAINEVNEKFEDFLKVKGLRMTRQREVILETIFASDEHFTAEELQERVRKIDTSASRVTVYRTLALLGESGFLQEIDLGRDVTYYDPNFIEHPNHNHLICNDCDHVVEFEDTHISMLEDCISLRLGFAPSSKSIRIEANCLDLKKNGVCNKKLTNCVKS